MRVEIVVLLALLISARASEESCIERCDHGFDATKRCQCDALCQYYRSCCFDYEPACRVMSRGDTFPVQPEDEETTTVVPVSGAESRRPQAPPPSSIKPLTVCASSPPSPDPDADACSGRPFDSFVQIKNGSVYAFRGKYFFELGEKSVLPGYPKLIEDIWGIKGPIDAGFTRSNCHGKTYMFKGDQYWRFNNGVLDEDFPRNISVGFENIPDHLDAAFSVPAHSYHGREKAYFFKADQYYQYEFRLQPSHEECSQMTRGSPSSLFTRYTDMYYNAWEEHFSRLFSGFPNHHDGDQSIDRDWIGIQPPVDAVLAGRLYVSLKWPSRRRQGLEAQWDQRQNQRQWDRQQDWQQQDQRQWDQQQDRRQWDQRQNQRQWDQQQDRRQWDQQQDRRQWDQQQDLQQQNRQWLNQWDQQWVPRHRQNRSPSWETVAGKEIAVGQEFAQRFRQDQWRDEDGQRSRYGGQDDYRNKPSENPSHFITAHWGRPLKSVYFFKGDQYYRVNLQTKRVDRSVPPYPRPIGRYWLGCPDKPGAEK